MKIITILKVLSGREIIEREKNKTALIQYLGD